MSFSEILIEQINKKDYDAIENYAGIIKQSSQKAVNLLMNLMDWAQSQTGRIEFNPERFNLKETIHEITALYDGVAGQKGIAIKSELPPKVTVFADKAMINTVLRNLISNAIKFTKPGGNISISLLEKEKEILFSIKDTGVGISKVSIEKLFLIDQCFSTSGTNNETGTGLGLILCKEFIERHGGKIWAESQPGEGSVFYFNLPKNIKTEGHNIFKNGEQKTLPLENSEEQVNSVFLNLKILIAEDDETSELLLSINVRELSNKVIKVSTGTEAVEICRNNPDLDLILMDIKMPVMNGYEATRQIRQFNKDIIIIAQTAFGLSDSREKAIEAGCNDYLAKPITKTELQAMIQKYFGK